MKLYGLKVTLANYCALRCRYCYVDTSDRSIIDQGILLRSISYYLSQVAYEKNIFFLGGEVLLNFEILILAAKFIREQEKKLNKKVNIFLTTSGLGITPEKVRILRKYNIQIGISIDGPRHIHNRFRVDAVGIGTFDRTMQSIQVFQEMYSDRDMGYTITVDEDTVDALLESFLFLSELDHSHYSVSIGCVYTKEWSKEHKATLEQQIKNICQHIVDNIPRKNFYYYNSLSLVIKEQIRGTYDQHFEIHAFPNGNLSSRLFYQSHTSKVDQDPLTNRVSILNTFSREIIIQSKQYPAFQEYIESCFHKAIL